MSGPLRTAPPPPDRWCLRPLLAAAALAAALGGCGGRDGPEDAPALLSTGIPVAAQNARGAPIQAAPAFPGGVGPSPHPLLEQLQIPPDPFEMPEMPDPPPAGGKTPGMHL